MSSTCARSSGKEGGKESRRGRSLCNLPPVLEATRGCGAFPDASFQGCGLCCGVCRLFYLPPEPPLPQPLVALWRAQKVTSASASHSRESTETSLFSLFQKAHPSTLVPGQKNPPRAPTISRVQAQTPLPAHTTREFMHWEGPSTGSLWCLSPHLSIVQQEPLLCPGRPLPSRDPLRSTSGRLPEVRVGLAPPGSLLERRTVLIN